MRIAINKYNKRIHINDVINTDYSNQHFYCPICNEELIVKNGDINISHFAHKSLINCDSFTSDMSEWHKSWQEKFPEENREVIIEYNGEKHRADVCINDCIIEFQHSPISKEEFDKRCDFYTAAGYTLFWVFDHIQDYDSANILYYDSSYKSRSLFTGKYDTENKYKWKNPPKFMKDLIPQDETQIFICFDFGDDGVEKIRWTATNDYDEANYKFFTTDASINYNDFIKYFKNRNKKIRGDINE